jgi:hypothetical protein
MTLRKISIPYESTHNEERNNKTCPCGQNPYKYCETHEIGECINHHLALHPQIIPVDRWNTKQDIENRDKKRLDAIKELKL